MIMVHGCRRWESIRDEENLSACTSYIHITRGLNPFHSSSYPNMASPWSPHHLWSESPRGGPLMWIWVWQRVGAEPPPPLQVLFAQGPQGVQDGQSCRSAPRLPPLEMARRREIPQIRRRRGKTWLRTADISSAAAESSLSRADCLWGCAQRPDCLRRPVNKCQSQRARLQGLRNGSQLVPCTDTNCQYLFVTTGDTIHITHIHDSLI